MPLQMLMLALLGTLAHGFNLPSSYLSPASRTAVTRTKDVHLVAKGAASMPVVDAVRGKLSVVVGATAGLLVRRPYLSTVVVVGVVGAQVIYRRRCAAKEAECPVDQPWWAPFSDLTVAVAGAGVEAAAATFSGVVDVLSDEPEPTRTIATRRSKRKANAATDDAVREKAAAMAKEVLMDETVQQQLAEIADLKKRLDSEKQKSAQLEGELQLARKRSR